MGIFERITKHFRPVYMQDPRFGRIRFLKVGLWEGKAFLDPIGTEAEVCVCAGPEGPTEAQRQIFDAIAARYGEIIEALLDRLLQETEVINAQVTRESLRSELRLDGISIDHGEVQQAQFSITFWVDCIGRMATFEFKEWRIGDVFLEC